MSTRVLLTGWLLLQGAMAAAAPPAAVPAAANAAAPAAAPVLSVQDAWVRQPPPGIEVAALYFTLHNSGERPLTLVGIRTPIARSAMLHETTQSGGMERMRMREQLVVGPGETVVLRPRGLHVMLEGLNATLAPSQSVPLELVLADGRRIETRAAVRPLLGP